MINKEQKGFSLIELLIVVVIIGVIAIIAVPALLRAKLYSENVNTFATIRTMVSTELTYFSQNNRYGRLTEINALNGGGFGTTAPTGLTRGKFTIEMTPISPSDAQLRNGFQITATKFVAGSEFPYTVSVDETGRIVEIYGGG